MERESTPAWRRHTRVQKKLDGVISFFIVAKTNPEKNILKQLFFVFGAGEGADGGDIHIYIIYPRKG